MTKNEIYTIRSLLEKKMNDTLWFIGKLIKDDPAANKESVDIQIDLFKHYEGALKSFDELVEKEGE